MAGFPYHQLDAYLAKIIAAGHRAAICEQVEDPKQAKGLVKREVTRIVTPGTLTDDALLDPQASNFLAAIAHPSTAKRQPRARASPGSTSRPAGSSRPRFRLSSLPINSPASQPAELLVSDDAASRCRAIGRTASAITRRPAWTFGRNGRDRVARPSTSARTRSKASASTTSRCADAAALRAAGAVLDYLAETQKASLAHIDRLMPYSRDERLAIDEATRRSLELVAHAPRRPPRGLAAWA